MSQATVEIYTWATCPFCLKAKQLLDSKGVAYQEHKIDGDEAARAKMSERAGGRRTVPQIFIGDHHVGGCDDLHEAESQGRLDALIKTD